jgi:molybdopterin synthase sulfur carrier subunit
LPTNRTNRHEWIQTCHVTTINRKKFFSAFVKIRVIRGQALFPIRVHPRSSAVKKMIRVILPQHLRTLAHVDREVQIDVPGPVTPRSILDAIEARYPMLRGTMRDQVTQQRRPLVRFFACEEDVSHDSPDAPLPQAVATGAEPFFIIGAIAGG